MGSSFIMNYGKKPTLVRSQGISFVDLTIVSEKIFTEDTEWKVLSGETLSDHKYIKMAISNSKNIERE